MSLSWYVEAALARACLALFRALGPVRASNVGGAAARTIGPRLPVSRVADTNLRLALPGLDAAERARIVRATWDNLGRVVAELPHIPALHQTESGPGWEIEGAEIVIAQRRRGGPAIFFSGHLGNWEMLPSILAAHGILVSSAYRAAGNPLVDRLIGDLRREALGVPLRMFPKGSAGARGALAHLARGGYLGLLMDQKQNDGIESELFGRPAMTASALAALALRFRCPVIPGYVQRLGPARFRLMAEPPLELPDSGDRQADIACLTRRVNACLERWIRARPEAWLSLHRRFPKETYRP